MTNLILASATLVHVVLVSPIPVTVVFKINPLVAGLLYAYTCMCDLYGPLFDPFDPIFDPFDPPFDPENDENG